MEVPPNLQDLEDLLLTSWYQRPQHTFRGVVESRPRRVTAVSAAKGRATQYWAGGHNVMPDECVLIHRVYYVFTLLQALHLVLISVCLL